MEETKLPKQSDRCASCVLGVYCLTGVRFMLEQCDTCGKNQRLISLQNGEQTANAAVYERGHIWDWEKAGLGILDPQELEKTLLGKIELPAVKEDRLVFEAAEVPEECLGHTVSYTCGGERESWNDGKAVGDVFCIIAQRCCACSTDAARKRVFGEGFTVLKENGGKFEIAEAKVTVCDNGQWDVSLDVNVETKMPISRLGIKLNLDADAELEYRKDIVAEALGVPKSYLNGELPEVKIIKIGKEGGESNGE